MGTSNPFEVVFVISLILFISIAIFAVLAPSVGVSMPAAPGWPVWASDLDWTVSLTNWSGVGSFFVTIGAGFAFAGSYLLYIVTTAALLFSIVSAGFIPPVVSGAITVLLGIILFGAILVYLRGGSQSK